MVSHTSGTSDRSSRAPEETGRETGEENRDRERRKLWSQVVLLSRFAIVLRHAHFGCALRPHVAPARVSPARAQQQLEPLWAAVPAYLQQEQAAAARPHRVCAPGDACNGFAADARSPSDGSYNTVARQRRRRARVRPARWPSARQRPPWQRCPAPWQRRPCRPRGLRGSGRSLGRLLPEPQRPRKPGGGGRGRGDDNGARRERGNRSDQGA